MNYCEAGHTTHSHKVVPTQVGKMTIFNWQKYMGFKGYCPGQDDVSRTLEAQGYWDLPIGQLITNLLSGTKRTHCIDVGAHIGYFSRMMHNLGSEVDSYECSSENIELLAKNVPEATIHEIWFDKDVTPATEKFLHDIHVMKIDIEGAEQFAIKYFTKPLVDAKIKHIIMEISPTFNDSYPALLMILKNIGYKAFELDGKPFDGNFGFNQRDLWLHR